MKCMCQRGRLANQLRISFVGRVDGAARPSNLASIKEKPRRVNYPQKIAGAPTEGFVRDVLCAQDERMDERDSQAARLREILAQVRVLAAEYYRLTGKPLGVTGEVATGLGPRGQR